MRMSELDRLAHNFEWKDPATQRDEVGREEAGATRRAQGSERRNT
jgi:hypothetical protein